MIIETIRRYRSYFVAVKRNKYGRKPVVFRKKHGVYYLAKLSINRDLSHTPNSKSRIRQSFIKTVNKYMAGDKRAYDKISDVYLRFIEDFAAYRQLSGNVELINVPSSNIDTINPIAQTISYVCMYADNENVKFLDGSNKIMRGNPKKPVDLFDRYSIDELAKTLHIEDGLRADTVILIDDACLGLKTIDSCRKVLKEAGVKKVYCLCLYMGCE